MEEEPAAKVIQASLRQRPGYSYVLMCVRFGSHSGGLVWSPGSHQNQDIQIPNPHPGGFGVCDGKWGQSDLVCTAGWPKPGLLQHRVLGQHPVLVLLPQEELSQHRGFTDIVSGVHALASSYPLNKTASPHHPSGILS